ncbi:hypothetical protein [uncultured Thalassospira sp.]|uniref:hypothetical protein n=1 Tax=uncultured Thalassospira sp. TaxID=404382 RepID=UPI0030DCB949
MPDTQTEESPTSPLNADDIVEKLAQADFLSGLLADPDVKAALLGEIRELGFRPPLHYVVLRLITALVAKSESFIGKAISSRLQAFIAKVPALAGLLERLITIQHGKETNDALKTSILGAITEGRPFDINAIEIDNTTPIETMLALHNVQGFERVLGGLDGQTDTLIRTFREDISNLFQNMVAPALSWPPEVLSPKGAFDRVKYTSGLDQLYGRDKEITLLHQFAGDLSLCGRLFNFRWMLLTGDGGTGKTRLAYDFTRKHLNQHIWDAGRLSIDDLPGFNDLEKWRPRQPTFIVIDYVSGHPEKTGKLLRILARKAAHYDFPVRVLLLERKADENWLGKMLPEDGDKPMVMNHIFGHEDEKGRIIPPVDATAIKKMMKERFAKAGQTPPDDALLLAAAQRVDTRPHDANLPRPLFALATAEAMMAEAEKEPEAQPDFAKIAALLNQEDVLAGMLRREEHTRWQPAAPNDGGGTLTRYKLALALATLTKGLDLNDLDTKQEDYGPFARHLPDPPPDHHQGMISALGGSHTFLPPLEPDIMGEFFLAETLLNDISRHRHSFLSATLEKGHIEPLITLLRLQQDFPQKIAAIDIPAAMLACQTETAAFSYASMAPDWVNQCYRSHDPDAADSFMKSVKHLVTQFDKNAKIALSEAKATFNICHHTGKKGEWERVDAMMARLDALRSQFRSNHEIALEEAKAAFNICIDADQSGDEERIKAMLHRFDKLRSKFSENEEIAQEEAKAAVNICLYALESGDWERVDTTLSRIHTLRSKFNENEQIARCEARAAYNISIGAAQNRGWERVEAMLRRFDALRSKFSENEEIVQEEAQAATNICIYAATSGDWKQVEAMLRRFDTLRSQFGQNEKIAIEEAKTAFHICFHAGESGDWKQVEAMLRRFDTLRSKFGQNEEIACLETNAAYNLSVIATQSGNWEQIEATLSRIDTLRSKFNENEEIVRWETKAAFNISLIATQRGNTERVKAMIARLITITNTFGVKFVVDESNGQPSTLADAINYVTEIQGNKP